jgi:hypothetical protein
MKTNSTQVLIIRIVLFILLCLYSFLVFGQNSNTPVNGTSSLQNFSGTIHEKNITLSFTLFPGNDASSISIEKSESDDNFKPLAEYWVNMEGNHDTEYKWKDARKGNKPVYYRLKVTEAGGKVMYSDILQFTTKKSGDTSLTTVQPG